MPGRFPLAARAKGQFWTPYNLGLDQLRAWWSADDHGTSRMTDDGAGLISTWVDRINGVSVTATTSARPTWASNSYNSAYAGLTFDGTANCFVSTSFAAFPTGAVAGEIWGLVSQSAIAGGGTRYLAVYGGPIRSLIVNTVLSFQVFADALLTDLGGARTGNFILGGNWAGTTEGGRINGADTNPATAVIGTLNTGTTRFRIGAINNASAANFWQGVIRHVFVTTTLTVAQRQQLEGWLAWDAGLTSLLSASHPYKNRRPTLQ